MQDLKQPLISATEKLPTCSFRRRILLAFFFIAACVLISRAVFLHILHKEFLQKQADKRQVRDIEVATHRGAIFDRHGEPLAISIPIDSIWVDPREIIKDDHAISRLAATLNLPLISLTEKVKRRAKKTFLYVKRHAKPSLVDRVMALKIEGVHTLREYRRFYPDAESSAQIIGFTNVDDVGQEGLELTLNHRLTGQKGLKRVILDGKRHVIENVESINTMQPGESVTLSIDRQLQFLTYRALKEAVRHHRAKSASAVILDVDTGEVLAMANYPSFNPNNRVGKARRHFRNRVVTDIFEPGSTIKPFTVANALMSGQYGVSTLIDTSPGFYRVGRLLVKDFRNYGLIDVTKVITVSSNVAVTKMALATSAEAFWSLLQDAGFGAVTETGFLGEVSGTLRKHTVWRDVDRATLSYGYGIAVTVLQLARSYLIFADDGMRKPISMLKSEHPAAAVQVMPPRIARKIRRMMETVVTPLGTGRLAAVNGYTIAGKTGTVKKSIAGGYAKHQYFSVFSGIAPASHPKLVMVVLVDDPSGKEYYGGKVAAPVFAKVMKSALRILGVAPDDVPLLKTNLTQSEHF